MENSSTNKGVRKAIPAAAAAVVAGSAAHPAQQRERAIPNYLKPTISSSCQHCTYPKHQQQSSTTTPSTPLKKLHSLNRAASIPPQPPDQQPLRTQRSLPPPPPPPAKAEKPSQKTGKAAAGLPKKSKESAAGEKSGQEEKITTSVISNDGSPPSCGGGSDESDPDKKEVRSENYWGSEESMAGEESAGEASSGAHQRGMIFVPLEMTKLKLMQRREAFEATNAADKVVVEENRRSKVKAIVGAFQKLEEASDVRSIAGIEREGEERRKAVGEGESGAVAPGLQSKQRNEEEVLGAGRSW